MAPAESTSPSPTAAGPPKRKRRNPWLSIWSEPRRTMAHICLRRRPFHGVPLIVFVLGSFMFFTGYLNGQLYPVLQFLNWLSPLEQWLLVVVTSVTLGPLVMAGALALMAAMLTHAGKLLDGQGEFPQVATVVTWSQLPTLLVFPAEIAWYLSLGPALEPPAFSPGFSMFYLGVLAVKTVTFVGALFFLVMGLTAAHRLVVSRAVGTIFLALGLVIGFVVLLSLLLSLLGMLVNLLA